MLIYRGPLFCLRSCPLSPHLTISTPFAGDTYTLLVCSTSHNNATCIRPYTHAISTIEMSVEKGPNTGPATFAGVDAPGINTNRNDSVSETVTGNVSPTEEEFQMPEVDMAYAASLKPSRLHGDKLLWMVTAVCGVGVSSPTHDMFDRNSETDAIYSLSSLDTTKVFCRPSLPSPRSSRPSPRLLAGSVALSPFLSPYVRTSVWSTQSKSLLTLDTDLVGCFFGALLNIYVGDWLGRKMTIYM